jgi:hypothetical protein
MGFYSHPTAGTAQYLDFEAFSGFCPDISTKSFAEEISYGTCPSELGLQCISRCLERLALSLRGSSVNLQASSLTAWFSALVYAAQTFLCRLKKYGDVCSESFRVHAVALEHGGINFSFPGCEKSFSVLCFQTQAQVKNSRAGFDKL